MSPCTRTTAKANHDSISMAYEPMATFSDSLFAPYPRNSQDTTLSRVRPAQLPGWLSNLVYHPFNYPIIG